MPARLAPAILTIALLLPSGAASAEQSAGATWTYAADPGCPPRAALVDAVAARDPLAGRSLGRTAFTVRIQNVDGGFTGALTLGGATREVSGAACREVVEALALILVLALRDAPKPPPTPAPVPEPAPVLRTTPTPTVSSAPPEAPWGYAVGAGVGVAGGVLPGVSPTVPVFVEVRRGRGPGLQPALRVGVQLALDGHDTAPAGTTRFTWVAGQLEPCVGWGFGDGLGVDGCARLDVGALDARAAEVDDAQRSVRPWVAVGPAARFRYMAPAGWFAELDLTVAVPLVRDRFFLDPEVTVHQASSVTGFARLQGGWSFW